MQSYFYDLEQQLYNTINDSPLPIDGKYYVIKDVFAKVIEAYNSYLELPEEQKIEEEQNVDIETEETSVERINNEDGSITINVSGKNIQDVFDKTMKEISPQQKEAAATTQKTDIIENKTE